MHALLEITIQLLLGKHLNNLTIRRNVDITLCSSQSVKGTVPVKLITVHMLLLCYGCPVKKPCSPTTCHMYVLDNCTFLSIKVI